MLKSELNGLELIELEFILKKEIQQLSDVYFSYKNRFGDNSDATKIAKEDVERTIKILDKLHETRKVKESE